MAAHRTDGMDVFDVRDRLIDDCRSFTTAFVDIDDSRIRDYVANQLERGEQWPNPGISRDDVDYILETFPIVKRKDIAAHGEYRTKRLILAAYDQMQTEVPV